MIIYTCMILQEEKNTQDHVSVFNKCIYACHANVKPKLCLGKSLSVKLECENVNDFTWCVILLFMFTLTTLNLTTQLIS